MCGRTWCFSRRAISSAGAFSIIFGMLLFLRPQVGRRHVRRRHGETGCFKGVGHRIGGTIVCFPTHYLLRSMGQRSMARQSSSEGRFPASDGKRGDPMVHRHPILYQFLGLFFLSITLVLLYLGSVATWSSTARGGFLTGRFFSFLPLLG